MAPGSPGASSPPELSQISLQKFRLYETRARFYLVGMDKNKKHWRILKIDRSEPSDLVIVEDGSVYSEQRCRQLLQQLAEGNRSTGGLQLVTKAYGIVGFIKFLESWYMILITKRRQIGSICGHTIYGIDESQLLTIPHSSVQSDTASCKTELRYKKLLSGVDLTKDFYFSYTYPITRTLQRNVMDKEMEREPYESMFVWNAYLTRGVRQMLGNTHWTVALCHGFFQQTKLSTFGKVFVITLIARRSRHFAGTRYLKRGVNDRGRVANEVETEQIVLDEDSGAGGVPPQMTSVVQLRGSIPLFWSQETSKLSAKPDIQLHKFDPMYTSTRLHFEDLEDRYGNPIIILNLIKTFEKRPREMILRREFRKAAVYLNLVRQPGSELHFVQWDFHKFTKSKSANVSANVLTILGGVASDCLERTGMYYSGKPSIAARRRARLMNGKGDTVSATGDFMLPLQASSGSGREREREGRGESKEFNNNGNTGNLLSREADISSVGSQTTSPTLQGISQSSNIQSETGMVRSGSRKGSGRDLNSSNEKEREMPQNYSRAHTKGLGKGKREGEGRREGGGGGDGNLRCDVDDGDPQIQRGILRTNCIDCLDRTNVAQYAFGLEALGRQLQMLGLTDKPKLNPESGVASALMDLYQSMGDVLALQYGGSAAHNTVFPEKRGKWRATTQSREFLLSIRRYYSNAYTDAEKQDAINLFLGHFQPQEGRASLWDLDTASHQFVGGSGSPENSPRELTRSFSQKNFSANPEAPPWVKNGNAIGITWTNESEKSGKMKLTSFDKLSEVTRGSAKVVRLFPDGTEGVPELSVSAGKSAEADVRFGMNSPEWLFGQKSKLQKDSDETSGQENEIVPIKFLELPEIVERAVPEIFRLVADPADVELYERYLNRGSSQLDGWYGTCLLPGINRTSEANKFYEYWCKDFSSDFLDLKVKESKNFVPEALEKLLEEQSKDVTRVMFEALAIPETIGSDLGCSMPSDFYGMVNNSVQSSISEPYQNLEDVS